MIPEQMHAFLRERLPEKTWQNRLMKDQGMCFMEFGAPDVDRLTRLGIEVDNLGPQLVVCMWDEESSSEVGGYLIVDNLAMGRPSMGGIRMLPDLTPGVIHNLARGMTLKNAAADLPYGGGKAGIVCKRGISPEEHAKVIRGFARLIKRYKDIYLPGPDVGTNDADMKTVAIENGMDNALSKPVDMGGNRIDELGAAAGGVIIALEAVLKELPRLRTIPQCEKLEIPSSDQITVIIQGFGAVGANAARFLSQRIPGAKVIGISDELGYLFSVNGLPVDQLVQNWETRGTVTLSYFRDHLLPATGKKKEIKYSNNANDLLRESAFCFIPAAPIDNYLDTDPQTHPSMTVDHMGQWSLIVEGANTYSPDRDRKAARSRMERAVYRQRGILIATDYLVNSGGVIYAAQEHLIKTPSHLRIPDQMLGDVQAVERWLQNHQAELDELAEKRRLAAEAHRQEVIQRNIHELIDLLLSDADILPCEAAEILSVRRIAASESDRTASEIMAPLPTISEKSSIQQAASALVKATSPILAVINSQGDLVGVVTEWDITRATSLGSPTDSPLSDIMTRQVIAASPKDNILEVIRKLEYHEISAMPVVDGKSVLGMLSSDLLARRSLLRLLQSRVS